MEQETPKETGVTCEVCGCRHNYVTNTWQQETTYRGVKRIRIRRRRVCRHCKNAFYTTEMLENEVQQEQAPSLKNPFIPE